MNMHTKPKPPIRVKVYFPVALGPPQKGRLAHRLVLRHLSYATPAQARLEARCWITRRSRTDTGAPMSIVACSRASWTQALVLRPNPQSSQV